MLLAGGGASDLSFQRPKRGLALVVTAPCASAWLGRTMQAAAMTIRTDRACSQRDEFLMLNAVSVVTTAPESAVRDGRRGPWR